MILTAVWPLTPLRHYSRYALSIEERTLAAYTRAQTGNEASVDRLMKQISGFMSDISDEFKVIIVDAIRSLCLKFPDKHAAMLSFLSGVLRDEGGYDFKRAVVEAIFEMVKYISACKEQALSHLCEFIEDCEFTKLSVRILHLLGIEGPKAPQPTKYIRFIYNRVVLENATVRAAAVGSLAKFGLNSNDGGLKKSINTLLNRLVDPTHCTLSCLMNLRRCLDDVDDEVRDRAAMYLRMFKESLLADTYVKEGGSLVCSTLMTWLTGFQNLSSRSTLLNRNLSHTSMTYRLLPSRSTLLLSPESAGLKPLPRLPVSLSWYHHRFSQLSPRYRAKLTRNCWCPNQEGSHTYTTAIRGGNPVRIQSTTQRGPRAGNVWRGPGKFEAGSADGERDGVSSVMYQTCLRRARCVPGTWFSPCSRVALMAVQFNVSNTIPDTILEQVAVVMQLSAETSLTENFIIPLPSLSSATSPGIVYVSFTRDSPEEYASGSFQCALKFVSKEVDPSTGEPEQDGYEDEYHLEEVELGAGDYIIPTYVTFSSEWDRLKGGASATETFSLSAMESLKGVFISLAL